MSETPKVHMAAACHGKPAKCFKGVHGCSVEHTCCPITKVNTLVRRTEIRQTNRSTDRRTDAEEASIMNQSAYPSKTTTKHFSVNVQQINDYIIVFDGLGTRDCKY